MLSIMKIPYAPLHFRSFFSLLRGCLSPEEICRYAREKAFPAVGMTDINNFYGLIRFIKAARQEQIKPVAGVVIHFDGKELFTAYILNKSGFSRISGIITKLLFHLNPYIREEQRISYNPEDDLLEQGWNGLCLVSQDLPLLKKLLSRERKGLFVKLTWGKSFFSPFKWAQKMGLPVMAVNDTVFLREKDARLHNILRAIDLNTIVDNLPEEEKILSFHRAAGQKEMEAYFSAVPEALKNAWSLVQESSTEGIINPGYIFPRFGGLSEKEAFYRLNKLCYKGVGWRYGLMRPDILSRLKYELEVIREKNFSSYFLVVHDIVSQCPRTCGRGSSASSIVSFLLGITHVDPLKYNLFFERFLNLKRKDPPDIDVDFPWDERDKILQYVFKKYQERSGMVANHVTFGPRSSIREPALALGIPEDEIKKLVSQWRLKKKDALPAYLREISDRIKGFPHFIGLHCGGVVITPGPVTSYSHIQPSLAGYPVIAWEKNSTEDAGLVKIDLLGNRSLSVLRDTLSLVNTRYGKNIEWASFHPLSDRKTRKLIKTGRTVGIFYVESPATRQLLKKMGTGDFEHLVIASSIIRPAANAYIREFVKRLHQGTYTPLHPLIADTLDETLGIIVYQEDVSRVAIDLAGFSIEEADALRKIISKKDRKHSLPDYQDSFFKGGMASGVKKEVLEKVWDMLLSFKGYSFCKAHSASYALVSFKLAFLKAHFPIEFMTSVINNGGGYYTRQTYINELRRLGFRILGPDVTASHYKYSIEASADELNHRKSPALRVGLSQLENLSKNFIEKTLSEQKSRPFCSLQNFIRRTEPGLLEMRVLIRSGALDTLAQGIARPGIFWLYFHTKKAEELFLLPPVPDFIGDYSEEVKLLDEVNTLGVVISRHPLLIFTKRIAGMLEKKAGLPFITSKDIRQFKGRRVIIAGLIVTGKEVRTKKDEMMIFVSFEDSYSIYETVFFPRSHQRFFHLLDTVGIYLISGKVEEDLGAISINVEDIEKVNPDISP